jgi:hypothetical protein
VNEEERHHTKLLLDVSNSTVVPAPRGPSRPVSSLTVAGEADEPIYVYRVTEVDVDARKLPRDAWASIVDSARFLRISREHVRRLVGRGKLESRELGGAPGPGGFRVLVSTNSLNARKREGGKDAIPP